MDQQRPQLFWTHMMRQRPDPEDNGAAAPPEDPVPTRASALPRCREPDGLLDGEKATAMLLFSGVALVLVGVTFTFMGWRYHQTNPTFEWLKLLGPILISVGGTFVLVSVCNFSTNFSWFGCRQGDDDVIVMAVTEQTPRGHCCTISARTPPITIHDVTAILRAPPEYNFIAPDARQDAALPPPTCGCGFHAPPPPPFRAAFPPREAAASDAGGNRCEKTEDDAGRGGDGGSTSSRPPAYEDIYPSFNAPNLP
ncbi:transmembrane protein 174 [Betta splendens]|uniref:Transmembrane protein 174 n=1 Tax=Betta splendens TaxID=158456 RepID=A0A9W2Y684_BETSP|nr:transmembrane protein 174 [Betta splendens]